MVLSPKLYDQAMAEFGLSPIAYDLESHRYKWDLKEEESILLEHNKGEPKRVRSPKAAALLLADFKIKALKVGMTSPT
ncbi:MAG: hypothetical protein EOP04_03215 [Proteobacteria bacterium]|nr:MAG: hypothetical protein EOP04_03215 [Pseudomonadota bacterium]